MPSLARLSKNNTTVVYGDKGNDIAVTLHQTEILRFNEWTIHLNTGGWNTVTTVTRMNQASNQFNLGYCVQRKQGQVFVTTRHGEKLNFVNNTVSFRR